MLRWRWRAVSKRIYIYKWTHNMKTHTYETEWAKEREIEPVKKKKNIIYKEKSIYEKGKWQKLMAVGPGGIYAINITRAHTRVHTYTLGRGCGGERFFSLSLPWRGVCAPADKTKLVPLRSQRWCGERRQPDHFSRLYDRVPSRARIQ